LPDNGRFTPHEPRNRRHWVDLTRGPAHRVAPGTADVPAALLRPASRRRDLLVPWTVILTGVLAVIAVAVTVNWAVNRPDDRLAQPVVPPPMIGAQPLAPATEWNLPLPTPSGSSTAAPSTPAPSRGTRAPSRSKVTAPPANALAISRAAVPGTVDLSAEGRRDWVHWGFDSTFSLERRRSGGFAILEGTPDAPRHRHALSPQRFTWDDGDPVARTTGTPSGIRTCGVNNGFTISAPAGTAYRTLRLYLGVAKGHGRLSARLSTGGTPVTAGLDSRTAMGTAVFTLTYKAPRKGTLKVTWTTEKAYDATCGGVAIQAATLR
jgi:hypothetical protein